MTISSLKHVIETGWANVATDDPAVMESKLEAEKISESSRIQRRGRVGRVAAGNVYYMYTRGSRAAILPKYPITLQNISDALYQLMSNEAVYENGDVFRGFDGDALEALVLNKPKNDILIKSRLAFVIAYDGYLLPMRALGMRKQLPSVNNAVVRGLTGYSLSQLLDVN